jgi:hypothetical protein
MAKNYNRVRKSNSTQDYTIEQLQEIAKCKADIVYFCRKYVKIQHPTRGSIPFKVYPYQIKMLRAYQDRRYVVVLSARQTGKSVTSAIYLLWHAMFNEDQNILIASNKNAGAMEMISRIKHAYEELPMWLKPGVADDGWNKHTIVFDNKSKIDSVATSEDSGRGKSISLLFLDEFAFVKPGIQTEFWSAILPTLSTGGSCIMTSTPNGDCNLFAQMWRSAQVGLAKEVEKEDGKKEALTFYPIKVAWDEPPGRDEEFKQQQIAQLGELLWRQEYLCEFLSSDSLLIDTIALQTIGANCGEHIREVNGFKFWEELQQSETYIIGVDPATGTGSDFTVIELFHFPSMRQVAEFRTNTMNSPEVYVKLKWLISTIEKRSGTIYFSVENNGVGEGIMSLYMNDENPPEFAEFVSADNSARLGFNTSGRNKMKACVDMKHMLESANLHIRSPILLTELKNYVRKRESYEAQIGSTDDCISAVLIAVRILTEIASYEQEAFDKLYTYSEEDYGLTSYDDFTSTGPERDLGDDEPLPMIF